jgi:hypothetical protein
MKEKIKIGTYFSVNLGQYFVFGRIIENYVFIFFDFQSEKEDIDMEILLSKPELFYVHVSWSAITSKRWKILDVKPLEEKFKKIVPFFVQEIGINDLCWIDYNGKRVPASKSECEGLERLATWDAIHVEKRIKDHYEGKVNLYLWGLRLK